MNTNIQQQLRDAARKSGLSLKAMSDRSGVGYQSMHGFVRGYSDLKLESAAKLATLLGLELRPARKRRGGG